MKYLGEKLFEILCERVTDSSYSYFSYCSTEVVAFGIDLLMIHLRNFIHQNAPFLKLAQVF